MKIVYSIPYTVEIVFSIEYRVSCIESKYKKQNQLRNTREEKYTVCCQIQEIYN